MSTEVMEKTMAVDLEPLTEFIQGECLDIVDGVKMDAVRFARLVNIIGNRVLFCSHNNVTDFEFRIDGEKFSVRVNNNLHGFVSVSNENGTGVSNTEYKPFWSDEEDGYFIGFCSLAQMVSEAWYHCVNNWD